MKSYEIEGEIIGKINNVEYYCYYNRIVDVRRGYINTNDFWEKPIKVKDFKKNFGCPSCKFYLNGDSCVCKAHMEIFSRKTKRELIPEFEKSDFIVSKKYIHKCDERYCCELYYPYLFDTFLHGESYYVVPRVKHMLNTDLCITLEQTIAYLRGLEMRDKKYERKIKKMEGISDEYRELKGFTLFFKEQAPELYKAIKDDYERSKTE